MKKRIAWLLMSCLVVLSLILASCAKPAPTTPTTPTVPTIPTTPAPRRPSGETLDRILPRLAYVTSLKYDLLMTAPGAPTVTQTVWVKKNKMRMETTQQEQTAIILIDIDAQIMYTYIPEQNMAMKMNFAQAPKSTIIEETKSIQDYNPTVVGTESIGTKICLVVEYTAEGATTKVWLWEEHGIPLREEVTTTAGTTTLEYTKIDFSVIPDSMFELPAGVQIIEQPGP